MILNKSMTYVFPLIYTRLCKELNIEDTFIRLIKNSYVFHGDEEKFILLLENNEISQNFLGDIMHSAIFDKYDIKSDEIAIFLNIPDEIKESYNNFINGRYSKINNTDKDTILQFAKIYFSEDTYTILSKVLKMDDDLKKYWMDKLGLSSFPENLEVSSIIDKEIETYG